LMVPRASAALYPEASACSCVATLQAQKIQLDWASARAKPQTDATQKLFCFICSLKAQSVDVDARSLTIH